MTRQELLRRAATLADDGTPYVAVTVVEAKGSTPADAGAKMLVTGDGPTSGRLDCGTVGGGRLEAKAIGVAGEMLAAGEANRFVDWNLQTDVGMTCGGRVRLYFEAVGAAEWPIVIFGAGHVTQALARLLTTLPCRVTCIDPRADWLARLPAGVQQVQADDPPGEVERLPAGAFILCMTRGHASDLPVLQAIFAAGRRPPFLGVIGSRAKAAVLRKELLEAGIADDAINFCCPVGLPIGTNHVGEIAVSIAAQLLEARDALGQEPSGR